MELEDRRGATVSSLVDTLHAVESPLDEPLQPPPPDRYGDLLDRVRRAVDGDTADVLLLDGDELCLVAWSGTQPSARREIRIPCDSGVIGRVAATGEPAVVGDLRSADEAWSPMLRETTNSMVAVPLRRGETVIGVLTVGTDEPHAFGNGEIRLLERAAPQVAAIGERARPTAVGGLERMHEVYAALVETMPEAVVVVDAVGTILFANSVACGTFGYEPGELVGLPLETLLPAEARSRHRAHRAMFLDAPRARQIGPGRDLSAVRKDGTVFPVEIGLTTATVGNELVVTAVVTDITERRMLRAQLAQPRAMEAVRRLATGVSHDFNNVLTGIRGFAELAHARLPEADPTRADIAELLRGAERGAALVAQLLAFSHNERDGVEPIDLNAAIHNMSRLLEIVVGEKVDLWLRLAHARITVEANLGALEQILTGLAANARDAMPDGGRLIVDTRVIELDESCGAEHPGLGRGRYARLAVTDTGTAMSPETLARAFEPFFTTKQQHGTGFGLATVYGIVERLGGRIRLSSPPGRGTTAEILLPLLTSPAALRHDSAGIVDGSGRGETILVAEDDETVRAVLVRFLNELGYRALAADSGEQALALAAKHETIDLLISDMSMPGITGPELAARLGATRPALAALVISGHADRRIDGVEIVAKPFSLFDVARRVRTALDASRVFV